MLSKEMIRRAAGFFKVVGDETRMKILCTISHDEQCVNDIAAAVEMTKSAVSHQLKLLREEGLVKTRRDGKNIFYSLDDQHVVDILDIAFVHIAHKYHCESSAGGCCESEDSRNSGLHSGGEKPDNASDPANVLK